MKTWIGTSGFQYAEWKGSFYPEDLAAAKMLPYFAERLSTTEINYTFHRIPSPKTIENWLAQTPENFRFALKAPQKITHFAKLRDCQDTIAYFYRVVSALGDRLGPVLFQLPPNFKKNADVLSAFLRELPAMRAAFEFRHESWLDDEIFALLRSHKVAPLPRRHGEAGRAHDGDGGLRLSPAAARRLHRGGRRALDASSLGKKNRTGRMRSFISNTRKPAPARSWPRR